MNRLTDGLIRVYCYIDNVENYNGRFDFKTMQVPVVGDIICNDYKYKVISRSWSLDANVNHDYLGYATLIVSKV